MIPPAASPPLPQSPPPRFRVHPAAGSSDPIERLLASARAALAAGDAARALAEADHLLAQASRRFATEERLMKATGYATRVAHAAAHETLLQLLRQSIRLARRASRRHALRALLEGLPGWFANHGQTMDAPFARHFAQSGYLARRRRPHA